CDSGPSTGSRTWYRFPRCGSAPAPHLGPASPRARRRGRAAKHRRFRWRTGPADRWSCPRRSTERGPAPLSLLPVNGSIVTAETAAALVKGAAHHRLAAQPRALAALRGFPTRAAISAAVTPTPQHKVMLRSLHQAAGFSEMSLARTSPASTDESSTRL